MDCVVELKVRIIRNHETHEARYTNECMWGVYFKDTDMHEFSRMRVKGDLGNTKPGTRMGFFKNTNEHEFSRMSW